MKRSRRSEQPDVRGNSRDRRARKLWLLRVYDRDLGPDACRCAQDGCDVILTYETVTVERIYPGALGGGYDRSNIEPLCLPCNQRRGHQLQRQIRFLRGQS